MKRPRLTKGQKRRAMYWARDYLSRIASQPLAIQALYVEQTYLIHARAALVSTTLAEALLRAWNDHVNTQPTAEPSAEGVDP